MLVENFNYRIYKQHAYKNNTVQNLNDAWKNLIRFEKLV